MSTRTRRGTRVIDPVLIIGTASSVMLGLVFYLREDTAQALGLVAGLLGGVITLQVQTLLREKRRIDHETRVGAMLAAIEKIPWLPDVMEPMLRAAKHVEREFKDTPAVDTCRSAFEECLRTLSDLERGHIRARYGEDVFFHDLIANTSRLMCATSVPSRDMDWWQAPVGRQYWQVQVDALARGVEIRRVFIYEEWTDALDALAREQVAAGARVRRVRADAIHTGMRVITAVWDETCAHERSYNAGGEAEHDFFTVSATDIQRIRQQFEAIELKAEVFAPADQDQGAARVT